MKPLQLALAAFAASAALPASASQLSYEPRNPTFGGNPINGQNLLSKAQAQNRAKDPDTQSLLDMDPVERFQQDLQRQILAQLARDIAGQVFGEDGNLGDGGVFNTGEYTIEVVTTDPDTITLRVTNNATGAITIIEIPVFGDDLGGG